MPSGRHTPGLGAEELVVTEPAKEGVVEAVPEEEYSLQEERRESGLHPQQHRVPQL